MKVEKCQHKVKCDFMGCGNLADYYVSTRGFVRNEFAFCSHCMKGLFEELSKLYVPKAIESHFKPNRKRRKDEKN